MTHNVYIITFSSGHILAIEHYNIFEAETAAEHALFTHLQPFIKSDEELKIVSSHIHRKVYQRNT